LLALLLLTGCSGHKAASASEVARAWSAALNRDDNEAAARLFASGAEVVQNGGMILQTHADAVRWNAGLPCGGRITSLQPRGKEAVLAVFQLTDRPQHQCDATGGRAAALFEVQKGKIVLWHQTDVPADVQPGGNEA